MSLDDENEETLVILQFTDIDDANYCQHFSNKFKQIDIEAPSPIIQIGNRFYRGEYTNNIGTYMLFEQLKNSTKSESQKENSTSEPKTQSDLIKSEYSGKSFKKLILNRLFLEEKESV